METCDLIRRVSQFKHLPERHVWKEKNRALGCTCTDINELRRQHSRMFFIYSCTNKYFKVAKACLKVCLSLWKSEKRIQFGRKRVLKVWKSANLVLPKTGSNKVNVNTVVWKYDMDHKDMMKNPTSLYRWRVSKYTNTSQSFWTSLKLCQILQAA